MLDSITRHSTEACEEIGRELADGSERTFGRTLEKWPLEVVLGCLHRHRRTAMLRVGQGMNAGVVFVRHGEVVRCEWSTLLGEEALLALLELRAGPLLVLQREIPAARPNVRMSWDEVMARRQAGGEVMGA